MRLPKSVATWLAPSRQLSRLAMLCQVLTTRLFPRSGLQRSCCQLGAGLGPAALRQPEQERQLAKFQLVICKYQPARQPAARYRGCMPRCQKLSCMSSRSRCSCFRHVRWAVARQDTCSVLAYSRPQQACQRASRLVHQDERLHSLAALQAGFRPGLLAGCDQGASCSPVQQLLVQSVMCHSNLLVQAAHSSAASYHKHFGRLLPARNLSSLHVMPVISILALPSSAG